MSSSGAGIPKGWSFPGSMSRYKVAEAFGLSAPAISRWVTAGCPKSADGTFDLRAVIAWYVERERDMIRAEFAGQPKGSAPAPSGSAIDRKDDAAATLLEIKVAAELGRFVDREATETAWGRAVTLFTSTLQSIPARIAKRCEGKDAVQIADVMDREIRAAIENMDAAFEAGLNGEDDDATEDTDAA